MTLLQNPQPEVKSGEDVEVAEINRLIRSQR